MKKAVFTVAAVMAVGFFMSGKAEAVDNGQDALSRFDFREHCVLSPEQQSRKEGCLFYQTGELPEPGKKNTAVGKKAQAVSARVRVKRNTSDETAETRSAMEAATASESRLVNIETTSEPQAIVEDSTAAENPVDEASSYNDSAYCPQPQDGTGYHQGYNDAGNWNDEADTGNRHNGSGMGMHNGNGMHGGGHRR